ncbi:cell envelope integrity protein TolA [Psychromonas sp. Urea-02u-13]|uniref:cell envelope integrity protein TolA n=1 Tax=Psychromonas sp. Urea-02u-13 TaxID=2058326 RepID=UPI000C31F047|nr:cell envelope integrity protein TolA [Psychromonas sp. Urea-02u-13]PKG40335.1 cell envelope integrity protein TolA [Psychromonas sp. Urea-02u-13]
MKNSTTFIAFITALSLHLIVGALLLLGMDFSLPKDKPKEEVVIINASMVSQKLFDDLAQKRVQNAADKVAAAKREIDKKRAEKARVKREKQVADKKRKQAEAKRVKAEKAEVARKQKVEDQILFEKIVAAKELRAKKAKKVADAKRVEKEKVRKKQEADRIKKQKAETKRVEAEKLATAKALKEKKARDAKLKADKAAKEKAAQRKAKEKAERLRQAELDKQMEAEFADSFSSAQSSKQLSEIARYKALIQDKISRNWQVESSMKGKSCTLAIRLAPDGLVLSASRSKGDQKLCDSARRATLKAKTLPIPKDPEIAPQFRDFDITLEPDL